MGTWENLQKYIYKINKYTISISDSTEGDKLEQKILWV